MSALDKEKIFVELREYHTDAFSDKLSTPEMNELREEFAQVEDATVSMLLNLVNGKMAYSDMTGELSSFKNKVKITKSTDAKEVKDRTFFASKIEHLEKILSMAKSAVFHLKVPRGSKVAVAK